MSRSLRRWARRGWLPCPQNSPLKSSRSSAHTIAPPKPMSLMYWTWDVQQRHSLYLDSSDDDSMYFIPQLCHPGPAYKLLSLAVGQLLHLLRYYYYSQ